MREVAPNIILMDRGEEPMAPSANITAVVNFSPTTPNTYEGTIQYLRIADSTRWTTTPQVPLPGYPEAADFVTEQLRNGGRVGVHCNAGFQRSRPFLAWYLHEHTGVPVERAVDAVCPQPHQRLAVAAMFSSYVKHQP